MTTQLYLQKAEMQLSRGLEEKALESLLAALACQDRDTVSETQTRCLLGECQFVHQQYRPYSIHSLSTQKRYLLNLTIPYCPLTSLFVFLFLFSFPCRKFSLSFF